MMQECLTYNTQIRAASDAASDAAPAPAPAPAPDRAAASALAQSRAPAPTAAVAEAEAGDAPQAQQEPWETPRSAVVAPRCSSPPSGGDGVVVQSQPKNRPRGRAPIGEGGLKKRWNTDTGKWEDSGEARVKAQAEGGQAVAAGPAAEMVIGSSVEAQDKSGNWYPAKVVDERGQGAAREYLVHYIRWKSRYDEWMDSGRLRAVDGAASRVEKQEVATSAGAGASSGAGA